MPASEVPPSVVLVVPGDPDQNTGGYRYVRMLAHALNEAGHGARVTGLPGRFPRPDKQAIAAMDRCLAGFLPGTVVMLDGLAMSGMPSEVLRKHAARLNLIAMIHHPLADETGLSEADRVWFFDAERSALDVVGKVITTSRFTAARLADFGIGAEHIGIAEPGVEGWGEKRSRSVGSVDQKYVGKGAQILSVGHFTPRKAQHQLVEALTSLADLNWQCTLVGSLDRDPRYSRKVQDMISARGLTDRIVLAGEVSSKVLAQLYQSAQLFVLPSLYEGYGMVIDEALAAGLPIISSTGGALAQTSARPGVAQYSAGDERALAARLRDWLENPKELEHATELAVRESSKVRRWADTATDVLNALARFAPYSEHSTFDSRWLVLREGADHRARSALLTDSLNRWLQASYSEQSGSNRQAPVEIVDIGTGRGSNAAFLVSRLELPQQWVLLDQDADLLKEAEKRFRRLDVPYCIVQASLTAASLGECLPGDAKLITASALIDLVSEDWLEALAGATRARQAALLVVLSYSGSFELDPPHPDDGLLQNLVNQHQHGDKGAGAALGPEATLVLKNRMERAGYLVTLAESPWHLGAADSELTERLMEGWVDAAVEQDPAQRSRLFAWLAERKQQLAGVGLSVVVHHQDLLALPNGEDSR
ncbi:glycosyl transferase family 1 [Marinobacter salinus]|uniref:Glycosyl transferase family 1 n=1 Tax=Marinobacter salinus TaxID=1874317 RepID=A0A1D9GJB9_9GAMM|nr:glycosyltransferase [Marinobacter salinus]AOY87490.1 glycosyl transferase family 1 [Marinobacter salinus]